MHTVLDPSNVVADLGGNKWYKLHQDIDLGQEYVNTAHNRNNMFSKNKNNFQINFRKVMEMADVLKKSAGNKCTAK